MIKYIIWWLILLFTFSASANVEEIKIIRPVGGNIWLGNQWMNFIWEDVTAWWIVYTPDVTANRICEIIWESVLKEYYLVEFTTTSNVNATRYYYNNNTNSFSFSSSSVIIDVLTCWFDSEVQLILDTNAWINKPIFDEETIIERYKIQWVIMFFIIFFYFFYRLIFPSKPKNIFKKNR